MVRGAWCVVEVGSDAFCGHWPVAEACCKLGRLAGLVGVILAFFGPFSNSQPLFILYVKIFLRGCREILKCPIGLSIQLVPFHCRSQYITGISALWY